LGATKEIKEIGGFVVAGRRWIRAELFRLGIGTTFLVRIGTVEHFPSRGKNSGKLSARRC
jgi:hypothetical protein